MNEPRLEAVKQSDGSIKWILKNPQHAPQWMKDAVANPTKKNIQRRANREIDKIFVELGKHQIINRKINQSLSNLKDIIEEINRI